jgi:hypothetical protein
MMLIVAAWIVTLLQACSLFAQLVSKAHVYVFPIVMDAMSLLLFFPTWRVLLAAAIKAVIIGTVRRSSIGWYVAMCAYFALIIDTMMATRTYGLVFHVTLIYVTLVLSMAMRVSP